VEDAFAKLRPAVTDPAAADPAAELAAGLTRLRAVIDALDAR
jgi:hypothetical protein